MKLGIRIWILIAFILFSIIAINPKFNVEGVEVTSVSGLLLNQGIKIGDNILEVNSVKVNSAAEFRNEIDKAEFKDNITSNNITSKLDIVTKNNRYTFLVNDEINIEVKVPDNNNIKKGLELEGGTRVLLKPVGNATVTSADIQDLISVLRNRLNIYGLTDLKIREASSGEDKLVLIEIAGVSRNDIEGFISQQGKFEAKIGDEVAFRGGKEEIPYVCRDDGVCSGVHSCNPGVEGYNCRFQFEIRLSPEAAQRQADITRNLSVITSEGGQQILSKQIEFYLDDELVDSLNIDASLKGSPSTQIQITGPGSGVTQKEALDTAIFNMEQLQTVLITGSLPFDIEIVKLDSISPLFGISFIKNTFLVVFAALLSVLAIIYLRYRQLKILLPMAITLISEILIILGMAALIGWHLDLAAIAGIIAAVGTGVDDQIVITDEIIRGQKEKFLSWKERIKKAFGIILVAYFATLAAMLPLWSAAAGLLRGFALTTILGISIGVLVTRPAFASMLEKLMEGE
ncbi:hypothetical protein J4442_05740 [Candidatus Woesearchaeota archaeon]|nr:hypothetical protein [Candidatus Woesearchaeota archaeon]